MAKSTKPIKYISEEEAREMLYQYVKDWRPGALFLNQMVHHLSIKAVNDLISEEAVQICTTNGKYNCQIKENNDD